MIRRILPRNYTELLKSSGDSLSGLTKSRLARDNCCPVGLFQLLHP
jgi:hypothetical protein